MIAEPKCPHCGNADLSMLEIEIIDNIRGILCNVCSKTSMQILKPISENAVQTPLDGSGATKKMDGE